jgi:hypothetical protein
MFFKESLLKPFEFRYEPSKVGIYLPKSQILHQFQSRQKFPNIRLSKQPCAVCHTANDDCPPRPRLSLSSLRIDAECSFAVKPNPQPPQSLWVANEKREPDHTQQLTVK